MAGIDNRDRLLRKLEALPARVRDATRPAVASSADEMVRLSKSLVPVDTGRLRESIRADAQGDGLSVSVKAGGATTLVEARQNSGVMVDLAVLVEFGTRPHINAGRFTGTHNPGMPARPYFFPAYRALKRLMKSRITRAMKKGIRSE